MIGWGLAFTKRHGYRRRGGFIGIGWSRSYRAHNPGLTDEELDNLWELGEDIAKECTGYVKLENPEPYMPKSCVYCVTLPKCTGDRQEVRPDLFRLIKCCFRHDALPEDEQLYGF